MRSRTGSWRDETSRREAACYWRGVLEPTDSLPPLIGASKTQAKRASRLRAAILRKAEQFIDSMSAPDEGRVTLIADFKAALSRLRQRRKARYWTDRRNTPVEDILFAEAYLMKRPGSP